MRGTHKNFIDSYFPNAKIVVDKFHVIRLIHPAIRKYRKEVTGDKRKNPIRHLLLKNRKRLQPHQKRAVTRFCKENFNVNEVYRFKEHLMDSNPLKTIDYGHSTVVVRTKGLRPLRLDSA